MRVLVVGSGGREHALAWKLAQSSALKHLVCAPGNPGMALVAENRPVVAEDPEAVTALARAMRADLVVVGPEVPLSRGVADALRQAGIAVFGPDAAAARLESSKAFAKDVMKAAQVATAAHRSFEDAQAAEVYARTRGRLVVKAEGLAAGKGVVVASSAQEAVAAIRELSRLGTGFLLEDVLDGEEVSVIALADGERFVLLPPAQDHKRLLDGDLGPNTGGMGAVCPGPLRGVALDAIGATVIAPVLREMARRGHPFRGALYAGLMLTEEGPRVLEFNARFGDPEAQVLVLQLAEDLLPLLYACATGTLRPRPLAVARGAAVGVVLASAGYPGNPRTGLPISGAEQPSKAAHVFHAATALVDGRLVTAGGRVLTVCAQGRSLADARACAYQAIAGIHFDGMLFRHDIGERALRAGGAG